MPRVLPDLTILRVAALPTPASAYAGQLRRTAAGLFWSNGTDWRRVDAASTPVLTTSGALTVGATHRNTMLRHSEGSITLPQTAGWDVGDFIEVRREAGAVGFVAASGAALDFNNTLYSAQIHQLKDVVAAKVVAANTWALIGPLADA